MNTVWKLENYEDGFNDIKIFSSKNKAIAWAQNNLAGRGLSAIEVTVVQKSTKNEWGLIKVSGRDQDVLDDWAADQDIWINQEPVL